MKRFFYFLILTLLVGLFFQGCDDAENSTEPFRPSQLQTVSVGDTVSLDLATGFQVSGDGLVFVFSDVLEESRCPTGVNCVWAGEVKVEISVFQGSELIAELPLVLRPDRRGPENFQDYNLWLTEVNPYPEIDTEVASSSYKVKVYIEKP